MLTPGSFSELQRPLRSLLRPLVSSVSYPVLVCMCGMFAAPDPMLEPPIFSLKTVFCSFLLGASYPVPYEWVELSSLSSKSAPDLSVFVLWIIISSTSAQSVAGIEFDFMLSRNKYSFRWSLEPAPARSFHPKTLQLPFL